MFNRKFDKLQIVSPLCIKKKLQTNETQLPNTKLESCVKCKYKGECYDLQIQKLEENILIRNQFGTMYLFFVLNLAGLMQLEVKIKQDYLLREINK